MLRFLSVHFARSTRAKFRMCERETIVAEDTYGTHQPRYTRAHIRSQVEVATNATTGACTIFMQCTYVLHVCMYILVYGIYTYTRGTE